MSEHRSVLLQEALELLRVRPGGVYVDGTVGLGGHAEAILESLGGEGRLIALDRDPEALGRAAERLRRHASQLTLLHADFRELPRLLPQQGVDRVRGCLLDLGVSSLQLETAERGFSFRLEGPLDMRMDPSQSLTAAQVVNRWPEPELVRIFRDFGEEPQARKIAAAILRRRRSRPLASTRELAELVVQVKGRSRGRLHPATQVFQALRIAVNRELEGLGEALSGLVDCLEVGGRLVVISFHSLEDRIVKRTFALEAGRCICFRPRELCRCPRRKRVRLLTRKPGRPSAAELQENPRARSALLRGVEKLAEEPLEEGSPLSHGEGGFWS